MNNYFPVGAGGEAFGFFEGANKIVQVVETALEAYLAEGILFVGEELAGQADAFSGDVFQRGEAKLFPKPFKKNVAAEVGFLAKRINVDAFGEVFLDVLQHEVEPAAVAVVAGAIGL